MKKISIALSVESVADAIKQIEELDRKWDEKIDTLIKRLAELGAKKAEVGFSKALYDGKKDIHISVEPRENGYAIVASGESVLFVEFGSGVTYGYGHPEPMQYGPGTYPSEKGRRDSDGTFYKNWEHPKGWWLPKDKGGGHTYGNPPSATMYKTSKELQGEILTIAREVFGDS